MKFKILLFLMYFGLFTNKVYSCADWRPFFSSPKNYIDIAYQAPEFSDVDYDQRKKFRQLLIHYADIARSEFVLNDS